MALAQEPARQWLSPASRLSPSTFGRRSLAATAAADDALQSIDLSFASSGLTLGNLPGSSSSPAAPWNASGSQSGTQYGTAGDYDLGSTDVTNAAGWYIGRSSSPQSGTGAASNGSGSFLIGKITFTPTSLVAG